MISNEGRTIGRQELYGLVWSRPMIHVAREFGISGNGLAKVCRKLGIPYPPRGYWAKHAVGKAPPPPPLPVRDRKTPETVTIAASEMDRALEPSQAQKDHETALARLPLVDVAERLTRPHSVIAGWIEEKKRRQQEVRNERDPWRRKLFQVSDFTEADRRRHRILDALFKTLEKEGGKVLQGDRRELLYEKDGETVEFQLRDKLKQVRRPLTDREKEWLSPTDKKWRQELEPTGKLIFEFKTYLRGGLRREWLESEAKPMEAMLAGIVATFIAAVPFLIEVRRERAEAERRRQEAEQQRQKAEAARRLNEARWRKFVEFAQAAKDTALARDFLERLKAEAGDLTLQAGADTVGDWLEWVEGQIATRDPGSRRPADLFGELARMNAWAYRD